MAEKLGISRETAEADLTRLASLLEHYRDKAQYQKGRGQQSPKVQIPPATVSKCIDFLKQSNLMDKFNEYIGSAGIIGEETYPLAFDSPFPYCRTKALAEQAVLAANDASANFSTIVLRPRFIWGPGDTTILPSVLEMAAAGKWTWIDRGAAMTSTTYIDNLVEAITLARSGGKSGQAYFILDQGTRSMHEVITAMAATQKVTLPDRSMPGWLARALGRTLEGIWRTLGLKSKPPLTAHEAMVMSRHCTLNGAKAERELGYHPSVSITEGLMRMPSDRSG